MAAAPATAAPLPAAASAAAAAASAAAPAAEPSLEEQLAQLREEHLRDRHVAAERTLAAVRARVEADLRSADAPARAAAEAAAAALATPFFRRVASECAEVRALRAALREPDDSWTLSYEGASTRVWYRREPHTASHTILTEGEIRAPLINVAALIYEADLYDRLFWYVTSARAFPVQDGTLLKRGAHISVYAPWPLYKRDVAVYAFGVDAVDEEEPCVLVVSRSMKEGDGVDMSQIEATPRTVRVDMHNSGFELVPEGPGVLKAKFLYNVDPHLSFVPVALINWIARMFCRWSLRTLESRARDLSKMPDAYQQRIVSEPIYEFIRGRLKDLWTARGMSQEEADKVEANAACRRPSDNFDPDNVPSGPPPSLMKQLLRGEQEARAGSSIARRTLSRLFPSSGVN